MKTIKFDSELGYYIINFEPIDIINEAYNCTSVSDNLEAIEHSQDWFEIQYETGGLCIVKFEDKFYLCDRQYYENIAGFYNHNEEFMDKEYIIENILCPSCSARFDIYKYNLNFCYTQFDCCNCSITIKSYENLNGLFELASVKDNFLYRENIYESYCRFDGYQIIIDFKFDNYKNLYNKLLKIKDLMIFN